jgi:hypothetical protein
LGKAVFPASPALFAKGVLYYHRWVPSVSSEAFWQLDRLKIFDMTAQFQHGIERLRRRAVREAGRQVVPPLLQLVQQACQCFDCVSPSLRPTAPIGRTAVSDNRRRFRRRSRGGSLAPRPISGGSRSGVVVRASEPSIT